MSEIKVTDSNSPEQEVKVITRGEKIKQSTIENKFGGDVKAYNKWKSEIGKKGAISRAEKHGGGSFNDKELARRAAKKRWKGHEKKV